MAVKKSKYPHSLKEWEYQVIKDYAALLTAKQMAKLLNRHWQTIYTAGKILKVKFCKKCFQLAEPEMPNIEEYKELFK